MIKASHVSKTFHAPTGDVKAIGDITTEIKPGEFVSIAGPSGCGKSTFLHIVAGFTRATKGEIVTEAKRHRDGRPNLGYIFQKDTVLPWYTVRQNVGLGLKFSGASRAAIDAKVDELLELAQLSNCGSLYPYQLSGGMRRRVALLMSLANDPEILLLDEPFGALDAHTRSHLQSQLLEIWAKLGQTVVMVTHDLDEAVMLSNRVIVLSGPPSRILLDERIDIPYPRDVFSIRQTPEFGMHFNRVWTVLGQQFRGEA